MAPYIGGSALAMASQVAEGYTLVTAVQLKRLNEAELGQLRFELERLLRDLRGTQVRVDEVAAMQAKSRKTSRITSALQQIQLTLSRRRGP